MMLVYMYFYHKHKSHCIWNSIPSNIVKQSLSSENKQWTWIAKFYKTKINVVRVRIIYLERLLLWDMQGTAYYFWFNYNSCISSKLWSIYKNFCNGYIRCLSMLLYGMLFKNLCFLVYEWYTVSDTERYNKNEFI